MHEEKMIQLFREEFRLHPGAQLVDYYKVLFQACFGSSHMVRVPQQAYASLEKEWLEAQHKEPILWQEVIYLDAFVRVNFSCLRYFKIDLSTFFTVFLRGTRQETIVQKEDFANHWELAKTVLKKEKIFKHLKWDQESNIEKRVREQQFLLHHSPFYRKHYHPHYRLLPQTLLNELITQSIP